MIFRRICGIAALLTALGVLGIGAGSASAQTGNPFGCTAGTATAMLGSTNLLPGATTANAPDTPAMSKCYGSCAVYWPPVTGTAAAGAHLPGKVATIRRTNGGLQLTYNGHPLYTYIGDSAPGQAAGNNLNLNGGVWHEVPAR